MSDGHAEKPHAVISGGSRGLGEGLVQGLLNSGYAVSTFSRSATPFVKQLLGTPGFYFAEADVADNAAVSTFVGDATKALGPPRALINCAGIAIEGVLATMRASQIDQLLDVNLNGALWLTREVVRRMLVTRQGGSIINVSSIVGVRGYRGLVAYGATKGAMDAMTRALARELGERDIRVNSIAPGYVDTQMTSQLDSSEKNQIIRRTPLGRLATTEDVVGPVLFLLSPAARFITGQVLVVDGGLTC